MNNVCLRLWRFLPLLHLCPTLGPIKYSTFSKTVARLQIRPFQSSIHCRSKVQAQEHKERLIPIAIPISFSQNQIGPWSVNPSPKKSLLPNVPKPDTQLAKHTLLTQGANSTGKYGTLSHRSGRSKACILAGISISLVGWLTVNKYIRHSEAEMALNPHNFTPFEVIVREIVSSTAIILTVRPSHASPGMMSSDPYKEWWDKGAWSVEAKQPELQIARSYTPLPPIPGQPQEHLRFLIRKEHKGEMSTYLHRLRVGSTIQLRGPHQEVELPESVSEVLFLAGGTGIAPVLQLIYTLLARSNTEMINPLVHIIWANRRRKDCAGGGIDIKSSAMGVKRDINTIVKEIERLRRDYPGQLIVEYSVDEEGTYLTQKKISQLVKRSPGLTDIQNSRLLFVSGPEGFIDAIAGPKNWVDGKQGQGALGGTLRNLNPDSWQVWKL